MLKKKKKSKGRAKREEKKEQDDEEEDFIRINKVNPFDYEEQFKPKPIKETMKRTFDDDLRDIVSDEEDKNIAELEEVKEKIEVEDDEKMIKDEDLGNDDFDFDLEENKPEE